MYLLIEPKGGASVVAGCRRGLIIAGLAMLIAWVPAPHTTPLAQAEPTAFAWAGLQRSYQVHLPAGYDPAREYPLVVALHGAGQGAARLEAASHLDQIADQRGFIVVYPQGSPSGARHIPVWNAGGCCGDAEQSAHNVDDVGFIREVVRRVHSAHRVSKTFVAGISNGAMMANRLGCEAADVFDGLAAVSGTIQVSTCKPARNLSVLIVHGTADPIVPYNGGPGNAPAVGRFTVMPIEQELAEWAGRERCRGATVTTPVNLQVDKLAPSQCAAPVELLRVKGGGHTWPAWAPQVIANFFGL